MTRTLHGILQILSVGNLFLNLGYIGVAKATLSSDTHHLLQTYKLLDVAQWIWLPQDQTQSIFGSNLKYYRRCLEEVIA